MFQLLKIEKALFYFLSLAFFWQWRLVWTPPGQQFNEWTSFYFYATDLLIVVILILWVARERLLKSDFKGSPKSDFSRSASIALFVFFIFSALSLLVAQDKAIGFYRLVKLLEFAGWYFYVRYNFAALYNLKRFWQWFIAGAALQSAAALAQFFTQKSLGLKIFAESPLAPDIAGVAKIVAEGEKIVRAYGLVPHPNILAAILLAAMFGVAWLMMASYRECHPGLDPGSRSWIPAFAGMTNNSGRLLIGVILYLLSVALFFTFSRSVIVVGYAFFIAWLIYVFWRNRELRKTIWGIFSLLAIGYSLLAVFYWPYVSARYDLALLASSQSFNMRTFYNQAALDFIKQSPWWGIGLGNFVPVLANIYDKLQPWVFQPVHNIYLLIAAETGIFALLAFLAFLLFTVRSAWLYRKDLSASYFLFIISCLLLIGLFDHFLWDIQQGQILLWLMLGLLAGVSNKSYVEKI